MHQLQIVRVTLVKLTGNVAVLILIRIPFLIGKHIPDGKAFAVSIVTAFDLIGGNGHAPAKLGAKVFSAPVIHSDE